MIGLWSVVSKWPAVFLLLAALAGILQAKLHRCLREFDQSNCNALEEVWAFDVEGQKCIEMVYGGCGKPTHLANRFESHEDCMEHCGPLVGSPLIQLKAKKRNTKKPPPLDLARDFRNTSSQVTTDVEKPVADEGIGSTDQDHQSALENMRSVLNYLDHQTENQAISNAQQDTAQTEQNQGRQYGQQGRAQPEYGGGLGTNIGRLPAYQMPLPYGGQVLDQTIYGPGSRPSPYQALTSSQLMYGAGQQFGTGYPQQSAQPPRNPYYVQGPSVYGDAQNMYYPRSPGPVQTVESYPFVQDVPMGYPYFAAWRTMAK